MHDRRTETAPQTATEPQVETAEGGATSHARHTNHGEKPPVAHGASPPPAPSASDRAYGPLDDGGRIMAHEQQVDGTAVAEASRRYGVPEADILAVITHESRGEAHANAGAAQKDHGRHAASGLMQVTAATWKATQQKHHELAGYAFEAYRYDRHINILFGTAALADKRDALTKLGIPESQVTTALTTMAFNAGEGIVSDAYRRAVHAGARNPGEACLEAEFLKPAIAAYPSVYAYYLTGAGKKANPQHSVERAVELKFLEISKYPVAVEKLVAEAHHHGFADDELDGRHMPDDDPERGLA